MLTICVVSYNVAPLLERCLESVARAMAELAAGGVAAELIVVDNASTDGSLQLVRHRFPETRLIANVQNSGFGAACNQGLAVAGETCLFLNPDTLLTPGALPALHRRLDGTPPAALVGPRLAWPNGRHQPSRRRFPTLAALLVESTPLAWRGLPWPALNHYLMRGEPERGAARTDWLSGACLLGRTAALRQVRGFDPLFFMYFEEVDLARRLAAHGWETWYEPAAVAVHHHSQSADQDARAKDRRYFTSKYRYARRYWGPAAAATLRLAGGLLFGTEAIVQRMRGDRALATRSAALAGWHVHART